MYICNFSYLIQIEYSGIQTNLTPPLNLPTGSAVFLSHRSKRKPHFLRFALLPRAEACGGENLPIRSERKLPLKKIMFPPEAEARIEFSAPFRSVRKVTLKKFRTSAPSGNPLLIGVSEKAVHSHQKKATY